MSKNLCKCGKPVHPSYGDKCEDCWVEANCSMTEYHRLDCRYVKNSGRDAGLPSHLQGVIGGHRVCAKHGHKGGE